MSGLYREEPLGEGQPSPWAGKFRVGGRVCQVGTEGCWENLKARSALICKIIKSLVLGQNQTGFKYLSTFVFTKMFIGMFKGKGKMDYLVLAQSRRRFF